MCNSIFDYNDDDFIYRTSNNMVINSNGDFHMRMGNNISMDTAEIGYLNLTTPMEFPERYHTFIPERCHKNGQPAR